MAEYIDLDTPLEVYAECGGVCKKQITSLRDLLDINKISYTAADVVEVVRCKDCDMAKSGSDEREMYCTFDHCYKGKNYFCADGRRKNEDSN